MKDLLAQKLLAEVTGVRDTDTLSIMREKLQALGYTKYDDYGGYMPGVKFIESLAEWLSGFEPSDRATALDFVMERLVYVSGAEMDHLVSTVYRDLIRPGFRRRVAEKLDLEDWQVARIAASKEFEAMQRRTLVLGMSDGARLDRLRRSSEFSTEQFHLDYVIQDEKARKMREKLEMAMATSKLPGEATFQTILVVDDFSGSGTTMLRQDKGVWDGKIKKVLSEVSKLKQAGVVADDAKVIALLYLMTARAKQELARRLRLAKLDDQVQIVAAHVFEDDFPLHPQKDSAFWELCAKYFRHEWSDEHMKVGGPAEHGFGGAALPLVLHHNAPNNSPPIFWKDEAQAPVPYERPWMGVFPRHERHHPGRP